MPKRSNVFQKLVFLIERQLSSAADVCPSFMLTDRVTGEEREVDIVISAKVGVRTLFISVEATERSRPADSTWVEAQIQKHQYLKTGKLVLVSSSGFTNPAREKTNALGVETLTLESAEDLDWTRFVGKSVGFMIFRASLEPEEARATVKGAPPDDRPTVPPDLIITDESNKPRGTAQELLSAALEGVDFLDRLYKHPRRAFLNRYDATLRLPEESYAADVHGVRHEILALHIRGWFRLEEWPIDLVTNRYGSAVVSHGQMTLDKERAIVTIVETKDGSPRGELLTYKTENDPGALVKLRLLDSESDSNLHDTG